MQLVPSLYSLGSRKLLMIALPTKKIMAKIGGLQKPQITPHTIHESLPVIVASQLQKLYIIQKPMAYSQKAKIYSHILILLSG